MHNSIVYVLKLYNILYIVCSPVMASFYPYMLLRSLSTEILLLPVMQYTCEFRWYDPLEVGGIKLFFFYPKKVQILVNIKYVYDTFIHDTNFLLKLYYLQHVCIHIYANSNYI